VRDALNLIHDLVARGVGVATSPSPAKVDAYRLADPKALRAVVLLPLFAEVEHTHSLERAARALAVTTAKGQRRPPAQRRRPRQAGQAAHLPDVEWSRGERLAPIRGRMWCRS